MERYGQVNPGYVSSRPNSLYSQAPQPQSITDYEASRPPSALTSYSNFHGQRPRLQKAPTLGMTHLTQESLNPYEDKTNASFDEDLPPPPPPLSSSPQPPHEDSESVTTDNTVPVPLQRNSRRNEYVNMPVSKDPSGVPQDMHSLSSASPDLSAPPLPPHNYANMPLNKNPLPPPRQEEPRRLRRQFYESDEPLGYNDTQTLRADQRLEYPPPPKEDHVDHGRGHFRQIHLDYDTKAEPQQATRIPLGHARRDNRASLRAKHRKEMEQANLKVSIIFLLF